MGAKANLLIFSEEKNISKADFYRKTGLSNGFLDKNDNISSNNIEIIISAFGDISPEWLLTGHGKMLRSDDSKAIRLPENSNEGIPLIPIWAMGGYGTGDTQVLEYECERFVVPVFIEMLSF